VGGSHRLDHRRSTVSCNTKQNVCTEAAWCWQAPAAPPWDSFLRHDRLVVSFLLSESLTLSR
jgi:hypothetical protein